MVTSFLEKQKKLLMLSGAVAVLLVFAVYNFLKIYSCPKPDVSARLMSFAFLATALIGCGCLIGCYFWLSKKDVSIEKFFIAMMLIFGVAYTVIFLPFTIPDEHAHYLSAYRVSNYFLFNFDQVGSEALLMRGSDVELSKDIHANILSADYYASIRRNFSLFSDNNIMTPVNAYFVKNAPLGYVASGLGIALGRLLHLGAIPTFYLGRLANVALYTVMVWWAIKRTPYGKTTMLVISALPMAMHITSSYSYDFFITAMAMLFVSQVLYMREKEGKVTIGDIILCGVWGLLLAPAKLVYFPLLLTVFLIPSSKFAISAKKSFLVKCGVVAAGLILLFLTQFGKISTSMGAADCVWTDAPLYSVSHVLSRPLQTLHMIADTLVERTDFLLGSMVGSHLGWIQLSVPLFFCMPLLLAIPFSSLRKEGEQGAFSFSAKLWTSLIGIGTAALVILSMLFSWTPVTAELVEGLQGRYFIPLLILLPIVLRFKGLTRPHNSDKYLMFFLVFYNLIMCMTYFGYAFT